MGLGRVRARSMEWMGLDDGRANGGLREGIAGGEEIARG